ncbi:MAG: ABC transporter substrate-binding protein [Chloroflexi bacterium]|nr:ABC transporter substrate-binding protein [Chloroflexota bacterium]
MLDRTKLTRGGFLKLSAMAAVGAAVAAVVKSDAGTAEAQMAYNESPMTAAQVAAGQLPPVSERLPANPYVVNHKWISPGKYGGTFRTAARQSTDAGMGNALAEAMYGHSPLRYLRDGLEIGPGLVESWESSEDASVWVLHLREGVKWSDGEPFSADDILFWWEDEVGTPDLKIYPPDEARSGKGNLMTITKLDDYAIQLNFDAPAPLTADRLAMWVNRVNGGAWVQPKRYLAPFHIKYNANLDPDNWVDNYMLLRDFRQNPDSPVLTGWKLESIEQGQGAVWVRNPYYWAVDTAGNQLPYVDRWVVTNFQDNEVAKLAVINGNTDLQAAGGMFNLQLDDIEAVRQNEAKSNLEIRLWDGGSGTSSLYFFNWNFRDPKMRALIREPKFRKALSIAYNRPQVQKAVYFGTGELTTGTMSPKAIEYQIPGGAGIYQEWRDSAVKYDPARAKAMLDEIGVKVGADGRRTMPDGSPLQITLDYHADAPSEHVRKNEFLAKDWQAIGINATLNPVPPTSWTELWESGKTLTRTNWEVGDGPNHLVYPQWVVPMETARWAPLNGRWYELRGTAKETQELEKDPYDRSPAREPGEPGSPIDRLWQTYDQTKITADTMERHHLVWDLIKIHIQDGPFFSGTAANTPRVLAFNKGLRNVPKRDDLALHGFVNPWIHPTPAVYDPETWYWDNPAAHQ